MNTAQIRKEYQKDKKPYVDGTTICFKTIELDGTYPIVSKVQRGSGTYYVLEISGKTRMFSERQLKYINYKEQSLDDIEKDLLNKEPIRFEKTLKNRKESLEDFLWDALTDRNINKNTIFVDSKKIHTPKGRRRSLGDWFQLCNYYFPDCSIKDVAHLLYYKFPKTKNCYRSSYCYNMSKRVFYHDGRTSGIFDRNRKDEYQKDWYQWQEIVKS